MATFVIVPCHFLGAAAWERVGDVLQAAGHRVLAPDPRGWGERRALLTSDTGLTTHVDELTQILVAEDLRGVTLIGHSYGGMVVAGVADRVPDRLAEVVFLDAPVPRHGDTLFDHLPEWVPDWYREHARTVGNGWRVPPPDLEVHGLPAADLAWLAPMLGPVSLRTCEEPLEAPGDGAWALPRSFVWCRGYAMFETTAARIRADPGWNYRELASGHLPMVTHPAQTAELLMEVDRLGGDRP
ncbi:MAG TPA: alpha/beta fold hydrolase [Gemmatimonadales bacterium]|nr:alpha/beta fold hydrolase [Gemmatimonadales bacterium]